jgi:hypothetical protein
MIAVYFMVIFAIAFSPWWWLVAVATSVGFIAITVSRMNGMHRER